MREVEPERLAGWFSFAATDIFTAAPEIGVFLTQMPALVINKRPYRTFLSHAHVDKSIVDRIYQWFNESAGIKVWYESVELPPAHMVASALGQAISECQSAIVV